MADGGRCRDVLHQLVLPDGFPRDVGGQRVGVEPGLLHAQARFIAAVGDHGEIAPLRRAFGFKPLPFRGARNRIGQRSRAGRIQFRARTVQRRRQRGAPRLHRLAGDCACGARFAQALASLVGAAHRREGIAELRQRLLRGFALEVTRRAIGDGQHIAVERVDIRLDAVDAAPLALVTGLGQRHVLPHLQRRLGLRRLRIGGKTDDDHRGRP